MNLSMYQFFKMEFDSRTRMPPRKDTFISNGVSRKFPTFRDKELCTVDDWIEGKKIDDGAEGLWRIHDDLYDLTTFIDKHPGGAQWLQLTRGTDITEAFETHHLTSKAEMILPKYKARKAQTPRNSLVTFHPDGFYKTLKKKISQRITETGPTWQSTLLVDGLMFSSLMTAIFATWWGWPWAFLSGIFLQMGIVASHNFFHMKDNWRMYYFNLSLMSYRDWRISHALSHHLFPNTILDLEITMWEPLFIYLPEFDKSYVARYVSWIISPILFVAMFHWQFFRRILGVVTGKEMNFDKVDLAVFTTPVFLSILSGTSLWDSFVVWTIVVLVSSFAFGVVGLTAAHHHPEIYHEGDHLGEDKDFGLIQLAAVRDRKEITGPFLVFVTFGDHALHHMFPTIDHSRLHDLYPALYETCKEFNIDYRVHTVWDMAKGMYQQLSRNRINPVLTVRPGDSKK